MIEVQSTVNATLEVAWPADRAYTLVADVPASAGHYPGLDHVEDLGQATYRWHLARYEAVGQSLDVGYTACYACDPVARSVIWTSVMRGGDNVAANGSWHVRPHEAGARLEFRTVLDARLPLPRLAGRLARRTVDAIFQRQIRAYLRAISGTMEGRLL
jgi:carbon monoxide dehydrogenase subunit G